MSTVNIGIFGLDDNPDDLYIIERAINQAGATNYKLFPLEEQLIEALTEDIHLIILDHKLTKRTGLDVLMQIRQVSQASYVIAYTGISDPYIIIQYIKRKVDDWVDKNDPDQEWQLVQSIKEGLKVAEARVSLCTLLKEKTDNK